MPAVDQVVAYVLADDGLFYADPRTDGPDWYLHFPADGTPRLVVSLPPRPVSDAELVTVAEYLLERAGIPAVVSGYPLYSPLRTVAELPLEFLGPMPRRMIDPAARGRPRPSPARRVYDFGKIWG